MATKFGLASHAGDGPGVLDSSPANIRTAAEGPLQRLGTDRIDLYYQDRFDPNTPIEDTIGTLAELIAGGKAGASPTPSPSRPAPTRPRRAANRRLTPVVYPGGSSSFRQWWGDLVNAVAGRRTRTLLEMRAGPSGIQSMTRCRVAYVVGVAMQSPVALLHSVWL